VIPRVLIAEPNADVRSLLELTVSRLGYEPVPAGAEELHHNVSAIILEPGCAVGCAAVRRFGDDTPPVLCLSIYPREAGLEPPASVAYLVKPSTTQAIGDALRAIFAD
jgi:hypothetical protein